MVSCRRSVGPLLILAFCGSLSLHINDISYIFGINLLKAIFLTDHLPAERNYTPRKTRWLTDFTVDVTKDNSIFFIPRSSVPPSR